MGVVRKAGISQNEYEGRFTVRIKDEWASFISCLAEGIHDHFLCPVADLADATYHPSTHDGVA